MMKLFSVAKSNPTIANVFASVRNDDGGDDDSDDGGKDGSHNDGGKSGEVMDVGEDGGDVEWLILCCGICVAEGQTD